ncbi:SDR family NAD(P)-dependent oxidoreductase [Neptunomonas qingdaonensis]|uniref:Short chain dehydrogenase n=1 Tax=Neptunomonas qingdaonensis TaxID=1045558 RepID=A0A1I2V500_9GAMM|nr:SDR family NAD(P)-dependent oxidoreductase [Neptunomonas qingdaonensis]SFG84418.1 short chain dehydrogenase [Neptunomonas qingdaonensis]
MQKTILITGSTDGIGLETAKMLVLLGHHVLLHGRNPEKLKAVEKMLSELPGKGRVESYVADLSRMADVELLANAVAQQHSKLDVLINNAGIYSASVSITEDGLDPRFAVNTIAPYLLTKQLMSLLGTSGRVVNLSSAAQECVDLQALIGQKQISDDFTGYAQSKLALTMWSRSMALSLGANGPIIIALNPGSMLGSKMVKDAFGVVGGDLSKGAKILARAALDDEFASASGQYFDNDSGRFAPPHCDALDQLKSDAVVHAIETKLTELK